MRLTLPAKQIPDGTKVMKPTGTKEYTLRKNGVTLYGQEDAGRNKRVILEGMVLLQCEEYLNLIPPDQELAVFFTSVNEARDFLDLLSLHEE